MSYIVARSRDFEYQQFKISGRWGYFRRRWRRSHRKRRMYWRPGDGCPEQFTTRYEALRKRQAEKSKDPDWLYYIQEYFR